MASIRKKTFTKPLPSNAEVVVVVTAQRPLEEAMTVRRGSGKGELTAKVHPEKQGGIGMART